MTRRELLRSLAAALLGPGLARVGATGLVAAGAAACSRPGPPNLVFMLVDDLRWDTLGYAGHPVVRTPQIDRIAADGVSFANAFVTTALCSPSRASFLTGSYAHRHGVVANGLMEPNPMLPTFPQLLQRAGYETALVGKWHMRPDASPRRGFDRWVGFRGQGTYVDPEFNVDGRTVQAKGYITDLLTEHAVAFLREPRSRPFCLYLAHKAVHSNRVVAERHRSLYGGADAPEATMPRVDREDLPDWLRRGAEEQRKVRGVEGPRRAPDSPRRIERRKENVREYYATLAAVDDSVGEVLATLDAIGAAEDTVVVFTSDNGFLFGEHGRIRKRVAYDRSMRIPLLVRGPGVRDPGRVATELVLNIDVAPTLLQLAGVAIPETVQGRSLLPLLAGESIPWRDSFLYEYFREPGLAWVPSMQGVRTHDWKYVRFPDGDAGEELYDLASDPWERSNRIDDPQAGAKLRELRGELARLLQETG